MEGGIWSSFSSDWTMTNSMYLIIMHLVPEVVWLFGIIMQEAVQFYKMLQ